MKAVADFIKAHKLVAALVGAALLFLLWQFGGELVSGIRGARTASQVRETQSQAQTAQGEAQQAIKEGAEAGLDRRVEDRIREQTIQPERERTEQQVTRSRSRTIEAQKNYEASQQPTLRPHLDDRALCERNRADYEQLHPGRVYPGCQ